MALTPSQRLTCKQEIAHRLTGTHWSEIDLHLEEFGASTRSTWDGDAFSYIVEMLKQIDDGNLQALAKHLGVEIDMEGREESVPDCWQDNQLRLFFSHLAVHKKFASDLQQELLEYGISAFVAHEDIEPTADWQNEIERALRTCDALLALLHPDFHDSTWTDQEIGYCLGRGVPVFSVRLGTEPYGLFGRLQAFSGHQKSIPVLARELFDSYRKHPQTSEKIADSIIRLFEQSSSFQVANTRCSWVEELTTWKPEYSQRLKHSLESNSQISGAWGVADRVQGLLAKHGQDPQLLNNQR